MLFIGVDPALIGMVNAALRCNTEAAAEHRKHVVEVLSGGSASHWLDPTRTRNAIPFTGGAFILGD